MDVVDVVDVVEITATDLRPVRDLYEQGLFLQAYRLAERIGPLKSWSGTQARILAGRLAYCVGAPRLGRALHVLAWRSDRQAPEAVYYYVRALLERRGLLAAWEALERYGDRPDVPREIQADVCTLRARVLGWLRDFDAAETWLAKAETLAPEHAWVHLERASLLVCEDRYEEALVAARRSLEIRPWYHPAVQEMAHVLRLLGHDGEALDLLAEAATRLESPLIVAMLASLQNDLGKHAEAHETLRRVSDLAPLMEKGFAEWLAGIRSSAAYLAGDLSQAAEFARQHQSLFFKRISERLAAPAADGYRVQLPVGFVRQHYATCAPATLAALARFWGAPADHLEVAAQICYDGTPDYRLRDWAERNGWVTREFTVTWDNAVALIDRGVPFALTTVRAAGSHLQAIIGYDSHLGTWLIRDPYYHHFGETLADELIKSQLSTGPRGIVLVPREYADRLASLDLADAPLYDYCYQIQTALVQHDRPLARRLYERMTADAPDHRLTRQARLALATYDADETTRLRCIEQLLNIFPDDPNLLLAKLGCLRSLARREDRLELLRRVCDAKAADPIFWQMYAQELAEDAREHPRAIWLLRRAIRYRPDQGGGFYILARILWRQRDFEKALALYRFAVCIEDKNEHLAGAYFAAARHLKQTEQVLALLKSRFEHFGSRSGLPARTLYWAYEQLDRTPEALGVLDGAMRARSDDGDLALFAASCYGAHGDTDRATALLERARDKCQRADWLRTAASLARSRGELKEALAMWQEVLETVPLAIDAHRAVTRLLAAIESRAAAMQHLEKTAERFPHSYPVHQLWIEWLRADSPEQAESVIRRLIAIDPADVWAHRELALALGRRGRLDEALAEADAAVQLDPADAYSVGLFGHIAGLAGKRQEGREALMRAIRLSVDAEEAIAELVTTSRTAEERREALTFIYQQLVQQVIFGDGLLTYRRWARQTLEPDELLASLREALGARPDLWHTWAAVVGQLTEMSRLDEALDLASQAADRFPLVPAVWWELARVFEVRGETERRIEALEQALRISPDPGPVVHPLVGAYERRGDLAKARALLEQALARDPLDAACHARLALLLWRQGEREAATGRIERALRLEPGHDWAWDALTAWALELKRPDAAVALARDLTVHRAGDVSSWLALAKTLSGPGQIEERLGALEQASKIDPNCADAYDLRAEILAGAGRFDEALAACRPAVFEGSRPTGLREREARVLAAKGDLRGAVDSLRDALKDDPGYAPGWARLSEWLHELDVPQDALEATEHLVRLGPLEAAAYGYRGYARFQCRDRKGAKADFGRAVQLNPAYSYALLWLFDLQLEDNEFDGASRTLSLLKSEQSGPFVAAREAQLAVRRRDAQTAEHVLRDLCLADTKVEGPLAETVAAMRQAGWSEGVSRVLDAAMTEPGVNPVVGAVWAKQFAVGMKPRVCRRRLDELRRSGDVGWMATATYVEELYRLRRRGQLLRFIRRYRDALRSDNRTWGSVGYVLLNMKRCRQVRKWMEDWAQRAGVQPWMLINAVVACRVLAHDEEAEAISRRAVTLDPDHTTWRHELWLAFDEALAGNADAAAERLLRVPDLSREAYYSFLRFLVSAAVATGRSNLAKDAAARTAVKGAFASAVVLLPSFRKLRELRRSYRRCLWRIARHGGGVGITIWALCKMVGS